MPSRYTSIQTKSTLANNGTTRIYKTVKYPEIPLSVNDIYAITTSGDRLDLLAQQFYGDITLYWVIAAANPDKIPLNSLFIPEGTEIRIPTDLVQIKSLYNKLNNI
jgi:hypothetical protein